LNGNPVFGFDNGRDYLAVKSIVVDHKLTLIGEELGAGQAGFSYLFQGPGYFYFLAIPFFLFNGNPVGGVFFMLLLGLSVIALGIYFISKFLGFKEGLLMGFLLACSPYLISQSRFFENPFATTLFILITFYLVYKFTSRKSHRYFLVFLAALFSGFLYNFEIGVAIPLCATLFIYCIFLFRKKIFHFLPSLFGGFILSIFPMILFEIRHNFMGLRSVYFYLFMQKISHTHPPILLWSYTKNIFNLYFSLFTDSFPWKSFFQTNIGLAIFIGFIIMTIAIFLKEKNRVKKDFLIYLFLLFPINYLIFIPLRNSVYEYYITDIALAYAIMLTYCLSWLYHNRRFKLFIGISLLLSILLSMAVVNSVKTSIVDYHDYGGTAKLKGKMDALDYIYKDADKKPFGLLIFTPPVYTYSYDYIIWWYAQKKYNYVPYKEKKGTYYLLIEEDPSKPWSYRGWEETVIGPGNVIYTKTLPSGFIVQKRIN